MRRVSDESSLERVGEVEKGVGRTTVSLLEQLESESVFVESPQLLYESDPVDELGVLVAEEVSDVVCGLVVVGELGEVESDNLRGRGSEGHLEHPASISRGGSHARRGERAGREGTGPVELRAD